jgi:MYXO-CTERM domain-containing protein
VNFRLEAGLEGGKTYRWRAQAADDLAATAGYSTPWSFTLALASDGGGSDGGDHHHEGDGCGCASGSGAPASFPALLLLLGLLFLKRRQG